MKELIKIEKENIKVANMAKRYIIIIGKKLGSNVQQKILLSLSMGKHLRLPGGSMSIPTISPNVNNPLTILKLLTKEQQNVVKIEYDKQEKYMNAYFSNKCAHLVTYKQLINSKNIDTTKLILNAIKKYFQLEILNGFYTCINCNFHIMCSHVYDRYQYQIDNLSIGVINNNLIKYAIKVKVNKGHEYYCKYCGEQLVKDIYIDDEYKYKPKQILSDVEIEIRNYTWSVIMNVIHSAELFNEKSLAIYISNNIRTLIEAKALNQFNDNIKLICIMYTFAFILLLMKDHKISFLKIDFNLLSSKIAEKLLTYMYSKYNTLIRSLNINSDYIKNEFMLAYKDIITMSKIDGPIDIPVNNSEFDLANFILYIDPIYKYAKNICRLFSKISFKTDISKDTLKKEFELILGTTLPNIIKSAKENIKNPIFTDVINKRFGSTLQTTNLEFFYKHPKLNIYNNLISIDNEDNILQKFLNGDHTHYLFSCYIMFCKYIKNIHNETEYDKFRELFIQFSNEEKKMLDILHIYSQKPLYSFTYKTNSHFVEKKITITDLYDENGIKHKWNVFYYGNTSFTVINNKSSNVIPGPKKEPLTDVGCSICGIKKSETMKLNIKKTIKSVNAMSDINSFYMFYKVRCPVNDLHEWTNNSCTKCKLILTMIDQVIVNKIDSNILEYYNTYLSKFIEEKKYFKKDIDDNITPKNIQLNKLIIPTWEPNYNPIVEVSKLTGYDTNIIESIGITEGRTYTEIEEGINIPEIELYNVYSAYSELIFITSKYMENNKSSKNLKYTILFDILLYQISYKDVHKFIIQSICEIVLLMNTAEIFITIIKNQKLLSVAINSMATDESDDVVYLGDDIGDSGEDLIVMQKVEDNYFSSTNVDYDFIENNESHIDIPNEYNYNYIDIE